MGKKADAQKQVYLEFIGNNANGVTGSVIYGKFYDCTLEKDIQFLLECGGKQDGALQDCYLSNMSVLDKIDCKNIDYVFLGHAHLDHTMLIPALVHRGFEGTIFSTKETKAIMPTMWLDGLHINKMDVKWLTYKKKIKAKPYYEECDVLTTNDLMQYVVLNQVVQLTPNISFKAIPNRHILGSCSLEMHFKDLSNNIHKLFYSSDLGNVKFDKYFINKEQQPIDNCNVGIYESTYSKRGKVSINKKLRLQEIYELKQTLRKTILEKKGSVLFPAFSLDRSPNLLKIIKDILDADPDLRDIEVVCDGKLTNALIDVYEHVCEGESKTLIREILDWKNLTRVYSFKITQNVLMSSRPKIILSSSGFCINGHIMCYLEKMLPHKENTVIFTGYSPPDSLASQIKNKMQGEGNQYVKIDEKMVKLDCDVLSLNSFSGHIMRDDLIDYITKTNQDKVVLVHGEAREELQEDLQKRFGELNKSTKVVVPKKNSSVRF